MQRRDVVVDADRDLGLVVVGQRQVLDRADALAADLHLAALDELPGVLEASRYGVPASPRRTTEQQRRRPRTRTAPAAIPGAAVTGGPPRARGQAGGPGGVGCEADERGGGGYSMPSGPWDSPERNWRTKALSELKSSSAGPDSTIRPFHSTEMCSATRRALMMSWVMTT